MNRRRAGWRTLAVGLVATAVAGGAVAALAGQRGSPVRLPPIAPDRLIASALRAEAANPSVSGRVTSHVDLGLPALPEAASGIPLPAVASFVNSINGDHTLRVWHSNDGLRVSELLPANERGLFLGRSGAWAWDFATFTAYRLAPDLGPGAGPAPSPVPTGGLAMADPLALARQALRAVTPTTAVSVDGGVRVAGRPAYVLALEPRDPATLVRRVEIDIDAARWLPLRVAVYATGHAEPSLSVAFTAVSFDRIDPSVYRFTPPPGAKVKDLTRAGSAGRRGESGTASGEPGEAGQSTEYGPGVRTFGSGWSTVIAVLTPRVADLSKQTGGLDLWKFLPASSPLFSIRLVDRGDHGWLLYGLVPPPALEAVEGRLP